jgi:hypothetical protein
MLGRSYAVAPVRAGAAAVSAESFETRNDRTGSEATDRVWVRLSPYQPQVLDSRISSAVEQRFCKPKVGGSIPSSGTMMATLAASGTSCPIGFFRPSGTRVLVLIEKQIRNARSPLCERRAASHEHGYLSLKQSASQGYATARMNAAQSMS